ncbi:MAG TPA: hypothetical protein PK294_12585 [Ignavibacteria bacterium]|nr:hypothetical protein [Ignavibacteria bacterium]HQY51547.1 hypothetical protein [Ignavibacteria bacterium]HRB01263.1 hypothetical protein [Ignavibacteria bacterium]
MKKKLFLIASLVVIVALSIFYVQNNNLIADDKEGKDCSSTCTKTAGTSESKSDCSSKTSSSGVSDDDNAGYAVYEFNTDKITCDACKTGMTSDLKQISGVKNIVYGETCNVSKTTGVKVYFSAEETNPEIISASVKEKGLSGNCEDGSKCTSKKKSDVKS